MWPLRCCLLKIHVLTPHIYIYRQGEQITLNQKSIISYLHQILSVHGFKMPTPAISAKTEYVHVLWRWKIKSQWLQFRSLRSITHKWRTNAEKWWNYVVCRFQTQNNTIQSETLQHTAVLEHKVACPIPCWIKDNYSWFPIITVPH